MFIFKKSANMANNGSRRARVNDVVPRKEAAEAKAVEEATVAPKAAAQKSKKSANGGGNNTQNNSEYGND